MDKEKLYNTLLENILDVYNSYLFLLLDSNKLKTILIDRLYQRKDEINNNNVKEIIKEEFDNITLEISKKDYFKIINNYTKVYKINNQNIIEIVNYLRTFEEFLEFINVSDNEDIMFKVIKDNNFINSLLEILVNNIISKKKYRYIKNNPKLESLINIYCIINNIDIDNIEEEKEQINIDYDINHLYRNGRLDTEKLYAIEIRRIPVLTYQEEIELSKRIKNGDKEALNKLVTHNLRFADSIANRYKNRGMELDDLRQSANEGLMKAAIKYNPDLGYKFSTYAAWWIKQSITRMFEDDARTIRVPVHADAKKKKYLKLKEELWSKLGHEPNYYEMQDEYNMDYDYITLMESISKSISSLDETLKEEDETIKNSIVDLIKDKTIVDFDNIDLFEEIFKGIKISKREKEILERRYKYDETGDMVALRYGISRQRVNQIESKIYARLLKNPQKRLELDMYREEYCISKGEYVNDMDKLNNVVNKILFKIKNNELDNKRLFNLFKELKLSSLDILYFILKYAFKMDVKEINKYNIIERENCNSIEKRIREKIKLSSYKDELLSYLNNSNKIIEELNLLDLYNEYLLIYIDKYNNGTLEEKILLKVSYYFNTNESIFINLLKQSKFSINMILILILEKIFEIDNRDINYNRSYTLSLERKIKRCLNLSCYKEEINNYLDNKDLVLKELNIEDLNNKKLIKKSLFA